MKKLLLVSLFLLVCFFASPSLALARNIVGINIGDHFPEFDQAAAIVGPGGWVVVMACPGDGETLNQMFSKHPEVNIIIRGHYPTQDLVHKSKEWALSWVATLGRIQTGNKIYFIPWNEPNNGVVNGNTFTPDYYRDGSTPEELINYINTFKNYLTQAGLRSKVFLLSPAMNVSNPSFSWYVQTLGGGAFFNQFDGIALDMYDNEDCGSPFCYGSQYYNSHPNNISAVLNEMGVAGKPVFFPETGVVIHSEPNPGPKYQDSLFRRYFSAAFPQWSNTGNFYMAAPFSYDPEHQESWEIYGSQTASLFRNTATSLGSCCVEQSPQVNVNSFIANEKLYECKGAGSFAVGYSANYCGQCGAAIGKPILISDSSHVCSDFERESRHSGPLIPISQPNRQSSMGDISGTVTLDEAQFPNFRRFQESMVSGLKKLLSYELEKNINLPGEVKMPFTHFVLSKDSATGEYVILSDFDNSAKGKASLPADLWGRLAGSIRGLCGFLGVGICPAVAQFQFQLPEVEYPRIPGSCAPGAETIPQQLPKPEIVKPSFNLRGFIKIAIEFLTNNLGELLGKRETEIKKIRFLSRSELPGGSETVRNSEFINGFLPQEVNQTVEPKDETKALYNRFNYTTVFSPATTNGEPGQYYELRKMRNAYCMFQCGLKPNGVPNDPLCPSCNPDDYKTPATPRTPCQKTDGSPDWSRNPQDCVPEGCRWNSAYHACDYGYFCKNNSGYLPHCERFADQATLEHGCLEGSQGPTCEDCVDSPYGLALTKDQTWCGGGRSCEEGIRCKIITQLDWENDIYDDPKYNGCYYANPNIKVRKDGVGGCLGLCNWTCPVD